MSDTEQLFILAGFWTAGALVLAYFIRNWWAKTATVVLLVGIPFWELPYGYFNFRISCDRESGMHVLEQIPPQKSICIDFPFDPTSSTFSRFGFERIEARDQFGGRHIFTAKTVNAASESQSLASEYCVNVANNNKLPWRMLRHDLIVVRRKDNAVVARHSEFDWFGMWWQEAASPVLGRGGMCRADPIGPILKLLADGS